MPHAASEPSLRRHIDSSSLSGPAGIFRVEVAEAHAPAWWEGEPCRFAIPFPRLGRIRSPSADPVAWVIRGEERHVLIARAPDGLHLAFDPTETFAHLVGERYTHVPSPITGKLPFHYHRVPHSLRLILGRMSERWRARSRHAEFPQWPIEPAWTILAGLLGPDVPGHPPQWPDGAKAAVVVCHDIDDVEGLRRMREFRTIDEAHGFRACWYVVGRHYGHDVPLYDELLAAGHEIGLHDYNHDNRLADCPPREIRRRLDACRPVIERFRITGFRSASLVRSDAMFGILKDYFRHDSTLPDTDSGAGAGVVAPFLHHGLVELPLTLPLDATMILAGMPPAEMLAVWRAKWDWIRAVGGLAVLTTHPEPHFSANPKFRRVYETFLAELASEKDVWKATPREVAALYGATTNARMRGS